MVNVSVIVPVYNVEEYLDKCLSSLVNQSMKNEMEIIVINDGTKDNSQMIIDKYAAKYSNIVSIKKQNEGLCVTRNLGISLAKAKAVAALIPTKSDPIKPGPLVTAT